MPRSELLHLIMCVEWASVRISNDYYRYELEYPPDEENWPEPIPHQPDSPDKAISLLMQSIEQGSTVVGIGPYTNLMLLEKAYPGILKQANLFLMGGHVFDIPTGYPQWSKEEDYNIQVDVYSAHYVLEHANPTLIPITITCQTALRRAYLPQLAQEGPLGKLIVLQAERFARSEQYEKNYGETCSGLPDDIINFQHDPLACAIALGWREGVEIKTVPLKFEIKEDWLYETRDSNGTRTRLVTKIDGNAFNEFWVDTLCR